MFKIKSYGICLYIKQGDSYLILLGKSFNKNKWGFLKGVNEILETPTHTAQREFFEECGIFVETRYFEKYIEQSNEYKDIGIYLVNGLKIPNVSKYFDDVRLKEQYQTCENEDVQFFDINNLPPIKSKQSKLIKEVIEVLNSY